MKQGVMIGMVFSLWMTAANALEAAIPYVTHRELQAVNQYGQGTYDNDSEQVIFEGIVLNNPEEILDPTPGDEEMGAQWQMYIQGLEGDHAGTAVWFGQNYLSGAGMGSADYTDEEVLSEMLRINADPNTSYIFHPGDWVKVTGYYKFYKGKTNLNEKHEVDSSYDFIIELVQPAAGLPAAEVITLDQVKDSNDNYIFDPNRLEGGEYYQGCRVRINNVTIENPGNWGPGNTITVADSTGRTFPVLLGIGDGIARRECPTGIIDVIGIFDQEASGYFPCQDGYRIWVPDYDGNGLVLTDRGYPRGNLPGDINHDYMVDLADFSEIAGNWMTIAPGLYESEE